MYFQKIYSRDSPKRTETDFQIELKDDVMPIKKGLYRMLSTELAEIARKMGA